MTFSPLRVSATVANSFTDQVQKEQTLPLLKKCQTHKTPFARWRIPTGVGITSQGENNLSHQLLKFPSVRHLPLTLPVFSPSPHKKRHENKSPVSSVSYFLYSAIAPDSLKNYCFFAEAKKYVLTPVNPPPRTAIKVPIITHAVVKRLDKYTPAISKAKPTKNSIMLNLIVSVLPIFSIFR